MLKALKINILTLATTCFLTGYGRAQLNPDSRTWPVTVASNENITIDTIIIYKDSTGVKQQVTVKESRRIVAVLLCITLGPFGMHRLYLGTEPQVAAAYSVTLGGGFGFVTVVDLFFLVFSKDISRFRNNPHFIMWRKQ